MRVSVGPKLECALGWESSRTHFRPMAQPILFQGAYDALVGHVRVNTSIQLRLVRALLLATVRQ